MYQRAILVLVVGIVVHGQASAQRLRRPIQRGNGTNLVQPRPSKTRQVKPNTRLLHQPAKKQATSPRRVASQAAVSRAKVDRLAILSQPTLAKFKRQYQTFNKIGPKDNSSFISLIEAKPVQGRLFYLAENALLKRLNDSIIADKDLVTSVCNAYKEILIGKMHADPLLRGVIEASYSDYKAVAFSLKKDSPKLRAKLRQAHQAAGQEFHKLMESLPTRALYEQHRGIAGKPEAWHLGGIGKSADTASLAARYARTRQSSRSSASIAEFDQASAVLSRRVNRTEVLRSEIQRYLGPRSPLLASAGLGPQKVLSPGAIELLRKAEGGGVSTTAKLRTRFHERFGVVLSKKMINKLRKYFALVDGFSSSLFLERRVVIDLAQAQRGVISVDFAGQGVKNHFQNQLALLDSVGQGSEVASQQARQAEKVATQGMEKLKGHFEGALLRSFGKNQRGKILFSGDDGIFMPAHRPSLAEKRAFLTRIAKTGGAGSFRVTFLPEAFANTKAKIPADQQSLLIVTAENIEKKVRTSLEGKVSYAALSKVMIGVDLQPKLTGGGTVHLLLAGVVEPGLAPKLSKALAEVIPPDYVVGRIHSGSK